MASKEELSGIKKKLYEIIFESDTPAGRTYNIVLLLCIVASVIIVTLESVPTIQAHFDKLLFILEWVFTIIFTLEYFARLWIVTNKRRYALSFFGIIDLLSILPTYLALIFVGAQSLMVIRSIRLIRIFRIFKLSRYVGEGQNLARALRSSRHKIIVFLVTVLTSVIIAGTMMFMIEGPEHGFTSIPKSIYWAIVTMTTVGYGDIAPQTPLGQGLASVIMILGYGIIAVPTGIVSAEMVFQKHKENVTTQVCPHCLKEGHDHDAIFCKYCSGRLN
ncbi:MAG TPA: ion transporter [Chryseolinea sp.]|nr:ion transporter [Chryseolinea sp.]